MEISFVKMQALENDFVVIDGLQREISLNAEQIRYVAHRHRGVGCDQLLLLSPTSNKNAVAHYTIFNADGSEVGQCGNGARCVATYLHRYVFPERKEITVETNDRMLSMQIQENDQVCVNMGVPYFEPQDIPMQAKVRGAHYQINLPSHEISCSVVSLGNPHAVILVDQLEDAPVQEIGQAMQQSSVFPVGVNVGFMQIIDSSYILLRVFERGVGETMACGSGACAAAVAGRMNFELAEQVDVELRGGHLVINWQGGDSPVWMTGLATFVYRGKIIL